MRTNDRYTFILEIVSPEGVTISRDAHPAYDKLILKYAKETDEMYYTRTLDNQFTFVGKDYQLIAEASIRAKFTLYIYSNGELFLTTTFRKGDGEIDNDHQTYAVSVSLNDEFKKLKDNIDNEYNLVDLLKGSERPAKVKLLPDIQIIEYNGSGESATQTKNYISSAWVNFEAKSNYSYESELFESGIAGLTTLTDVYRSIHNAPTFCKMNITVNSDKFSQSERTLKGSIYDGEYSNMYNSGSVTNEIVTTDNLISFGNTIYNTIYHQWELYLQKKDNSNLFVKLMIYVPRDLDHAAYYSIDLCKKDSTGTIVGVWNGSATYNTRFETNDVFSESGVHSATEIGDMYTKEKNGFVLRKGIKVYGPGTDAIPDTAYIDLNSTFCFRSAFIRSLSHTISAAEMLEWLPNRNGSFYHLYQIDHDKDELAGTNYNFAYNLCAHADVWRAIAISDNTTGVQTKWELKNDSGYYYLPPTAGEDNNWCPLFYDVWDGTHSIWIKGAGLGNITHALSTGTTKYTAYTSVQTLANFYSIGDAIKAMLAKIDPSIVFEENESHSQFFYSEYNPITNQPNREYWITQKSNLLQYVYDYAAWKAPCTMRQMLDMMKYAFNCYYDIYEGTDGKHHLRIEHVLFYMNGLSYTQTDRSVIRLGDYFDVRTKKPLSFRTNKWKYDSETQPNRIEFAWMDTQSEPFAGYPIIIPDGLVIFSDEKTQKNRIDWFSTDVNFMLAEPSECSSDGFLLAEVAIHEGESDYRVTEDVLETASGTYVAQNISLSFMNLHQTYFPYNIYAKYVRINTADETKVDNVTAVRKLARLRENEVEFIAPRGVEINPSILIATDAGTGEASELELDLSCGKVNATLRYEIEEDSSSIEQKSGSVTDEGTPMVCENGDELLTEISEIITIE